MGLFKSSTKLLDTRTPQHVQADKYLAQLLEQGTPDLPTEQIAGMSDAEQLAQQIVGGYGVSKPEGLDTLRSIATGSTDITQDPAIQALIGTVTRKGDLTANRLSRSLMLRGGRGGAGQDMLGRQVTNTQQEMLSTLAPYAESAKNRQMSAAQLLNQLGESSTLNRLNALSTTGSLPRTLKQMQNQANYQRQMQQILFPYQQNLNVAQAAKSGSGMSVVKTPSILSQISSAVSQVGSMIMGTPSAGGGEQTTVDMPSGQDNSWAGQTDWMNKNAKAWNMF